MINLQDTYAQALQYRQNHPQVENAGIEDLARLPSFSGFVEANVGSAANFNMFICAKDDLVALRLFWLRAFEPMSSLLWSRLCQTSRRAADIGAHSGYYTLLGRSANPSLKITSFEPHPIVFARLLVNLRANGLDTDECANQAVTAGQEQTVDLFVNAALWAITSGSSTVQRKGQPISVRAVNVQNLTRLFGTGPDLIKMDVEGAEESLLISLAKVDFGAVKDMLVEQFNPWSEQTMASLQNAGWTAYRIDEKGKSVLPLTDERMLDSESRNLWLTRRSNEDVTNILDNIS